MTEALRHRDPETLTPYEAVLRSFGHNQRVNASEHAIARAVLERAVRQPPDRADCRAMLAWIYREEYTHGFNLQPDPLGRALTAARRAGCVALQSPGARSPGLDSVLLRRILRIPRRCRALTRAQLHGWTD